MDRSDGGYIQSSPKREFLGIKTLRTLTIKQINNCDFDEASSTHMIDSAEVTNVQIVGWVVSSRTSATGSMFVLEDGTESVDCTFWPSNSYEEEQCKALEEHGLLQVNGSLRTFNGKRSVSVSHLAQVEDPNLITYHFLNCIYQHLFYTRQLQREEVKSDGAKLGRIQEDILECYRKNQDENGLHINVVIKMLSSKYPESEIKENIDVLLRDCHLYSVDGLEYKTTV
ncbi:replication factor A protein 2 [Encephalitozoon intestinalis ATCC 50506]|uniref:Replication factor A protein 2 n=1 Tax=Encephalitozoon intestinalis (strain ATCC 50506) TaxID=876142 RepID=E0S7F7_ENCIT|nr:replication factor A protein 2 [Encephalitozoon intestinalis ATCC 50506]ADM11636.1 replication factor A protein 2 [Encephalitozoon intestinalis ATCC 50506]UTX45368.1 OB-fold nucleic acid binding domain-containing protein [Encephalitozoon intestinalis]